VSRETSELKDLYNKHLAVNEDGIKEIHGTILAKIENLTELILTKEENKSDT